MFALTNFFDVLFEVIYGKYDLVNKESNSKSLSVFRGFPLVCQSPPVSEKRLMP